MRANWFQLKDEAMFWRLLREALYDDMADKPVGRPPLCDREIEEIRFRFSMGETQTELASEFRISQPEISRHVRGVPRLCGRGTGIRRARVEDLAA